MQFAHGHRSVHLFNGNRLLGLWDDSFQFLHGAGGWHDDEPALFDLNEVDAITKAHAQCGPYLNGNRDLSLRGNGGAWHNDNLTIKYHSLLEVRNPARAIGGWLPWCNPESDLPANACKMNWRH